MRPLGQEVDRMPVDQAYLPGSPFWQFHAEAQRAGFGPDATAGMPPEQGARMDAIVIEELGWAMPAWAVSLGAGGMPMVMARASGNKELIDLCEGKLGCWGATQPDRGSDGLILYPEERYPGSREQGKFLQATFIADEVAFNGQTSAWVSNGAVAQVALMDVVADYGEGFFDEQGNTFGCNVIVPLDLKGCRAESHWKNSANVHCRRARSTLTTCGCRDVLPSRRATTTSSSTPMPGRTPVRP